jgi:hypothetical protein
MESSLARGAVTPSFRYSCLLGRFADPLHVGHPPLDRTRQSDSQEFSLIDEPAHQLSHARAARLVKKSPWRRTYSQYLDRNLLCDNQLSHLPVGVSISANCGELGAFGNLQIVVPLQVQP